MIHGAHMAFATEFLPVGLWPTEPKGGAGPGNGRDDALALALVSEDLIVTGSQARQGHCLSAVSLCALEKGTPSTGLASVP